MTGLVFHRQNQGPGDKDLLTRLEADRPQTGVRAGRRPLIRTSAMHPSRRGLGTFRTQHQSKTLAAGATAEALRDLGVQSHSSPPRRARRRAQWSATRATWTGNLADTTRLRHGNHRGPACKDPSATFGMPSQRDGNSSASAPANHRHGFASKPTNSTRSLSALSFTISVKAGPSGPHPK